MHSRLLWPAVVLISGDALLIVMATGAGGLWRAVFALWFVLICPGASLVSVLGLRDRLTELVVIAPLSLALVTLTSSGLFYGHVWSLKNEFGLLLGLCTGGLIWSYFVPRGDLKGDS
jgi:hypothetical protein